MSSRITFLAVLLTAALATPAFAGTYTFDVATSFAPANDTAAPANPFAATDYADYPQASAWTFQQGSALSHAAGSGDGQPPYTTLNLPTSSTTNPFPGSGLVMPAIIGTEPAVDGTVRPYFVENSGPGDKTYANATFPVHKLVVSPGTTQNSIIAFKVPVTSTSGKWSITGSLADAAPSCGDGVDFWIDKNAGNLVNGTLGNAGMTTIAQPAVTNLTLTTNDTIYLTLGSKTNGTCDATTVVLDMVFAETDKPAPSIQQTTPPARTNVTQPVFSGTLSTAFGDNKAATLSIVDDATSTVVRTVLLTGSNWTSAWANATPSTPLPDGNYTVTVNQSDQATPPNASVATPGTNQRTIAIDTVSPTVTLDTGPAAVGNAQPTTFTGTAGDAVGDSSTVSVKIYSGTTATGTPRILTGTRTGTTYTVNFSGGDLADGPYVAVAEQADDAGNDPGKSADFPFLIDTTPPAPTITTPSTGETLGDNTPTIAGTAGTATRDDTKVTVEFFTGSGAVDANALPALTKQPVVAPDGTWSVDSDQLTPDGPYSVRVTQTDSLGNTLAAANRAKADFTIDTSGPDVTLQQPTALSDDQTPNFSGTAGQAPGDADVIINIYSGKSATGNVLQTVTATPAAGLFGPTADNLVTPVLPDGYYTAQATQKDIANNTGRSEPQTFHVDLNAPDIAITAPSAAALLHDTTPTISGTAGTVDDDSTTVTLRVYKGDDTTDPLVQTLTTTRDGAAWSRSLAPLEDGQYTVQAEQKDQFGRVGTSNTRTFDIDVSAPTVTLDTPSGNGAVDNGTTVSGTMSESGRAVSLKVYEGKVAAGTPIQSLAATVNGTSWSRQLPTLDDGTYTLQAEQTDTAGNVGRSAATPTLRIDSESPDLEILTPDDEDDAPRAQ